ncbi:MAG: V-type ATP synthase subunit D [Anaerovoracaceae bacterium]|jgi:V/A-type H+-transporting ATPase subunit D
MAEERLNVNPTRMELTTLKRRLVTARRGHKLMKDKRDELMKNFLELARENARLREDVEKELAVMYKDFEKARSIMSSEAMQTALMFPKQGVKLNVTQRNIMSVNVPVFDFETTQVEKGNVLPYGFARTSGELDGAIEAVSDVFPKLLDLAAREKETQLLAAELEKTRRRVNALEYVMIPRLENTIRYIQMKLDENERANQTRLMKVKDMVLEDTHHYEERLEQGENVYG